MPTRFYFPLDEAAAVSPALSAEWEHQQVVRRQARTTPDASALTTVAYTPDGADHLVDGDAHHRQYVSDPLSAQSIAAQTVTLQVQGLESNPNNQISLTWKLFVVSHDGTTIKETLLAIRRDLQECASVLTNRNDAASIASATVEVGDRLVVELGVGGQPISGFGINCHNGSLRWGCDAAIAGTDDFNRANSTDLGAAWESGYTSLNPYQIIGNRVRGTAVAASSLETSTTPVLPGDHEASITLAAFNNANESMAAVVLRGADPPTRTCYGFQARSVSRLTRIIRVAADGAETVLGQQAVTWVAGDRLTGRAVGSQLSLLKNGVVQIEVTDTTLTSGRAGIWSYADVALTDVELDEWQVTAVTTDLPVDDTTTATSCRPWLEFAQALSFATHPTPVAGGSVLSGLAGALLLGTVLTPAAATLTAAPTGVAPVKGSPITPGPTPLLLSFHRPNPLRGSLALSGHPATVAASGNSTVTVASAHLSLSIVPSSVTLAPPAASALLIGASPPTGVLARPLSGSLKLARLGPDQQQLLVEVRPGAGHLSSFLRHAIPPGALIPATGELFFGEETGLIPPRAQLVLVGAAPLVISTATPMTAETTLVGQIPSVGWSVTPTFEGLAVAGSTATIGLGTALEPVPASLVIGETVATMGRGMVALPSALVLIGEPPSLEISAPTDVIRTPGTQILPLGGQPVLVMASSVDQPLQPSGTTLTITSAALTLPISTVRTPGDGALGLVERSAEAQSPITPATEALALEGAAPGLDLPYVAIPEAGGLEVTGSQAGFPGDLTIAPFPAELIFSAPQDARIIPGEEDEEAEVVGVGGLTVLRG